MSNIRPTDHGSPVQKSVDDFNVGRKMITVSEATSRIARGKLNDFVNKSLAVKDAFDIKYQREVTTTLTSESKDVSDTMGDLSLPIIQGQKKAAPKHDAEQTHKSHGKKHKPKH